MSAFSIFWASYGSLVQFTLINMILAISIYITLYTGMLSLANAGFMAIGAYLSAVLTIHAGLPLPASLICGGLAAMAVGFLLGLPVLRLHGIYLAIATIGFGEIVRIVAINFDKYSGLQLLGGAEGLAGVPKLTTPAALLVTLAVLIYLLIRLPRSRTGRALAAIRQDENVAASMGIDVFRYKMLAFLLGAFVAGLAGGFDAHLTRFVDPNGYGFDAAVNILAYAILGGTASWVGPLLGAGILTILPESLRFLQDYRGVVNGLIIVIVILYLPRGLVDPQWFKRKDARRAEA